jgi:adenylate cyclase
MPTEIERKFLVRGNEWKDAPGTRIVQGYLCRDRNHSVRVRIADARAFLTIKGATTGVARPEFEYAIPLEHAEQLLQLCEKPLISKLRHVVEHDGMRWEIDEFAGDNAGLVVAEIELEREDQPFARPPWLGREVSDDPRYYNSNLVANPYRVWRESPES